jgi:hypothetical protein
MGETGIILANNSGHNVLTLKKQASQDLTAMATLYYMMQVAGGPEATGEAKRQDISHFLDFYADLFHH